MGKDLIRKMLTVNQQERWTAKQLLRHPWITSGSEVLSSRGLTSTIENLKKFNAKNKFRAAARAVMASNRMSFTVGNKGKSDILHVQSEEQRDKMLLPHQTSFLGKKEDLKIEEDYDDE